MADRQLSLAEAMLDPRMGMSGRLSKLSGVIDWAPLERLAAGLHASGTGRPPFDGLAMLKALYLQAPMICPIRVWRRRSSTGCRSDNSAASRSISARPTRRRCAASATRPPERA